MKFLIAMVFFEAIALLAPAFAVAAWTMPGIPACCLPLAAIANSDDAAAASNRVFRVNARGVLHVFIA